VQNYVNWFRTAAPYINAHKGKTVVLAFGGDVVQDERFAAIVHDIAILSTLGLKIVLVHGTARGSASAAGTS
jgi:amino-acid N-acetyltransferase